MRRLTYVHSAAPPNDTSATVLGRTEGIQIPGFPMLRAHDRRPQCWRSPLSYAEDGFRGISAPRLPRQRTRTRPHDCRSRTCSLGSGRVAVVMPERITKEPLAANAADFRRRVRNQFFGQPRRCSRNWRQPCGPGRRRRACIQCRKSRWPTSLFRFRAAIAGFSGAHDPEAMR